jgi:hypothetical protein
VPVIDAPGHGNGAGHRLVPDIRTAIPCNRGQGIREGDFIQYLLDQWVAGARSGGEILPDALHGEDAHALGQALDVAVGFLLGVELIGL